MQMTKDFFESVIVCIEPSLQRKLLQIELKSLILAQIERWRHA